MIWGLFSNKGGGRLLEYGRLVEKIRYKSCNHIICKQLTAVNIYII